MLDNLSLPEHDLTKTPDYNMVTHSWWDLKNNNPIPCIIYNNAFSVEECKTILKYKKCFSNEVSRINSQSFGQFTELRKSYTTWVPPCEMTNWLFEKLSCYIGQANVDFGYDLTTMEHLQLTEYDEEYEGRYGVHNDNGTAVQPGILRKLSFSVCLSDRNDYEGGELKIYNKDFCDPIIGGFNIGDMTIFSSYILHEVTPVKKGTRNSLVSWCSGPKFK